jgi:hypothetical protein
VAARDVVELGLVVGRGHHDGRGAGQALGHGEAAHVRQVDVEQDELGREIAGQRERSGAVRRLADDVVARVEQQPAGDGAEGRMVVDDEDTTGHRRSVAHCRAIGGGGDERCVDHAATIDDRRRRRHGDSPTPALLPRRGTAARAEERDEQLGRLGLQDARVDLRAVVEPRLGEDVEDAARRARLRVGRRVDHARHAREDDRARAHRARLERHVERAVEDAPRAEVRGGGAQGEHLGVRGRVLAQLALVVAGADHLAVVDDDGADRDVVVRERQLRLGEREAHVALVTCQGVWGAHARHNFVR